MTTIIDPIIKQQFRHAMDALQERHSDCDVCTEEILSIQEALDSLRAMIEILEHKASENQP